MRDEIQTTALKRSGEGYTEDSELSQASAGAPAPGLARPRRFGRYELLLELASGGMATLYIARLRGPELFEKQLAIKIIHPHLTRDPKFVRMFLDEARLSALIQHPNVVQIFELGAVEDSHFIAMEYVHGHDMRAVLKANSQRRRAEGGPPARDDWRYAAAIVADAAAGLHQAHELRSPQGELLNVVHRDVSPHNLLISYDGHVKLTDFGIAYARHRLAHTDSGTVKGKLAYMAPEHARGDRVDRRADIFSLGVVLWEAVCLRRLFRRETDTATILEVTRAEVPPPRSLRPDLPPALEAIILRALSLEPPARYATAQAMEQELRRLLAHNEPIIGAAELAAMMGDLFAEPRAAREQALRRAVASKVAPVAPAPAPEATHETRLSAEAHSALRPPRPGGPLRWALPLASALVLGLGIGGYLLLRDGPPRARSPRPAGEEAAGARPAPPRARERPPGSRRRPAPRKLLVTFTVTPPTAEATIHFRGQAYRQARVQLLLAPGTEAERVRVEAPGYASLERTVTVSEGAELSHALPLRPLARRRPGRAWRPPRRRGGVGPVDIGLD